jgi:hypothetical protein
MFSEREVEVIRREDRQLSDKDDLCTTGILTTPLALSTSDIRWRSTLEVTFKRCSRNALPVEWSRIGGEHCGYLSQEDSSDITVHTLRPSLPTARCFSNQNRTELERAPALLAPSGNGPTQIDVGHQRWRNHSPREWRGIVPPKPSRNRFAFIPTPPTRQAVSR